MNRAATPEITLSSTELSIAESNSSIDPRQDSFAEPAQDDNPAPAPEPKTCYEKIKEWFSRPKCKKICNVATYVLLVICFGVSLFAFVFGLDSDKPYTSPEKQCSGYDNLNGKSYINCFIKPSQCSLFGCSESQCMEYIDGTARCLATKFDTYYEPPMIIMAVLGGVFSCVLFAILVTSAIHCCMHGGIVSICKIATDRFPYSN